MKQALYPTTETAAHRTLLVDDHQDGVEFVLTGSRKFTMVARACSGHDALALMQRLHPELVLMDFIIPDMNVVELIHRIKSQPHAPRVVVLSQNDDYHYRNAAMQAGADGFVGKTKFGPKMLARIDHLCDEPAQPTDGRLVEAGTSGAWSLSLARSVATVVIALSCVVGASFMSWHYWQEEHRATQREQDQQRQRLLNLKEGLAEANSAPIPANGLPRQLQQQVTIPHQPALAVIPQALQASKMEREIIHYSNLERTKSGLPSLIVNPLAMSAAEHHAHNMARSGNMAHVLPGVELPTLHARLTHYGCKYGKAGENIARNHADGRAVVAAWMDSPAHQKTLLDPDFTDIGVGVSYSSRGEPYYAQVLLRTYPR